MIEKIPVPLESQAGIRLKAYLRNRVRSLKDSLRELHETRFPNWRRIYEATPIETTRQFPFQNASNLVVPIVAIHCDTLLARVMSAVLKTKPVWSVRILGLLASIDDMSSLRDSLEEFGNYVAIEPEELDLYRVYHEWLGETIRYGASVVKSPIERDLIDTVVPAGDGSGRFEFVPEVEYEGPRPFKIPFNDFFMEPSAPTVESADFKAHRVRLRKHHLQERAFRKIYDPDKVKAILAQPDRNAPDIVQQQKEEDAGVSTSVQYDFAEWDIYECWCRVRWNNKYVRIIAWYHEKSDTILRAFFNYYPDEPFVLARLFYRDDMWCGYGFCETLAMLQEEISQIHNQRRDNMTVANTRIWRVHPDSKLHKGYRIYPSAMLPADENEIEPMAHGEVSPIAIEEERLSLELAEKRSGISSPMQGQGAGTNTKRGVYTAMGTLSLLQEGNTRTDLNISDIRYAHTKLGRMFFRQYAAFGLGDRKAMFGKKGDDIERALRAFFEKRLALPINASNASVNREVEKQNDLMLSNVFNHHYQTITQMLTAANNPMTPEPIKGYIGDAMKAANLLARTIARHFGFDEVERLVPEVGQQGSAPAPPGPPMPGAPTGNGAPGAGEAGPGSVLPALLATLQGQGGKQ